MKNIIFTAIIMAFALTSCNQKNKEAQNSSNNTEETAELYSCPMHPEVQGKKGEACSKCGMELTEPVTTSQNESSSPEKMKAMANATISTDAIVKSYLDLKNKLVADDSNGAATNGKELYAIFNKFDTKSLDATQKKQFSDIVDDAKEHAEHIGANAGKIDHQREHFAMLSKDVHDLIKDFGTSQKLYQDYCPMYDQGKSGYWISEVQDIKNPYYGAEMLTCGSVKMEIN